MKSCYNYGADKRKKRDRARNTHRALVKFYFVGIESSKKRHRSTLKKKLMILPNSNTEMKPYRFIVKG